MQVKKVLDYNKIIKAIIDNEKDIDALVKFRLLGMCKQFEPIVANFETVRDEKIMQYGTITEDGSTGIIPPNKENFNNDEEFEKAQKEFEETVAKFTDDLDKVLDSEIQIEIKKFKPEDIMDAGLPADYLLAIYDLIEE